MCFGLFSVEAIRDIDVVLFREGCRCKRSKRDALVRRAEQHVETDLRFSDGGSIIAAEFGRRVTGIEQAGIEKVGTDASGLERELAKTKHAEFECEFDEFSLVATHLMGLLYDCRDGPEYDSGDCFCFALSA